MDEIAEARLSQGRKPLILKIFRLLIQFFFFLLFGNLFFIAGYNFLGGIAQFNYLPFPVMQSHITPFTTITGAYDVFMEFFSKGIFPFLALGILLIFGILIGRASCGWMCPFGFVLDIIYYIPVKKRYPGYQINNQLSKVKFFLLFLTFFVAIVVGLVRLGGGTPLPLGPFTDNPYSPLDPATTLQAVIPSLIINPSAYGWPSAEGFWAIFSWSPWFWFRVFFMVIIFILCAYIGRFWCRYVCPLGGMLGLFNAYSIIGVKRNITKCLGKKCRACEAACPMGIPLLRGTWEKITDSNCILCFRCYEACEEGAIGLSYFKTKQT
jgi:polyferredoxin